MTQVLNKSEYYYTGKHDQTATRKLIDMANGRIKGNFKKGKQESLEQQKL